MSGQDRPLATRSFAQNLLTDNDGAECACHDLPKKSSSPPDAGENPHECGSEIQTPNRLATTAPLGLAPVRPARASAATTGETSAVARLMAWTQVSWTSMIRQKGPYASPKQG
jgi:hypothetical protein